MNNCSMKLQTLREMHEVHRRILKGRTGGQNQFAAIMHMHPTTLQRRLEGLRAMGADIVYDRIANTYYYRNNFDFEFHITVGN